MRIDFRIQVVVEDSRVGAGSQVEAGSLAVGSLAVGSLAVVAWA